MLTLLPGMAFATMGAEVHLEAEDVYFSQAEETSPPDDFADYHREYQFEEYSAEVNARESAITAYGFVDSTTEHLFVDVELDDGTLGWCPIIYEREQAEQEARAQEAGAFRAATMESPHGELRVLHQATQTTNRITIKMIADRYTQAQQEEFFTAAQAMADYIVSAPPLHYFAPWIQIYGIGTISPDENQSVIVGDGSAGTAMGQITVANTRPFVQHHFPGMNPISADNYSWLIIQRGRSGGYAGFGYFGGAVTSTSLGVGLHEMGHLWGLWDEYDTPRSFMPSYVNGPNTRSNVDLTNPTGGILSHLPWVNTAITPQWGLFIGETSGADNHWQGFAGMGIYPMITYGWGDTTWYRPRQHCIMNQARVTETFCHVCSEHLVRRFAPNRTDDTRIRSYAYAGDTSFQIGIPDVVTAIGDFAFIGASGLETVINHSISPQQINDTTFAGLNRGNIEVFIPVGTTLAYRSAGWTDFILREVQPQVVTFNPNGGTWPAPAGGAGNQVRTILRGGTYVQVLNASDLLQGPLQRPPTRADGLVFSGWWTAATGGERVLSTTLVSNAANRTLFARWEPLTQWEQLREHITQLPQGDHTIILTHNIAALEMSGTVGTAIDIPAGVRVTLQSSAAAMRTLTQTNNGQRHFVVGRGASLTLGSNITLSGGALNNTNNAGGVSVLGGTLHMQVGSVIEHCYWRSIGANGGAVLVEGLTNPADAHQAIFTMSGGTIRNNSAPNGGGVFLIADSHMTMTGGTIEHNNATAAELIGAGSGSGGGGGVYIWSSDWSWSTFTMSGGTIRNNSAVNGDGGGIFTAAHTYESPLPPGMHYTNLYIGANAIFSGNTARGGQFTPPLNAMTATQIRTRSSSVAGTNHPLNNMDINFPVVHPWDNLRAAVNAAPANTPTIVPIVRNLTVAGATNPNAIHIPADRNIILESNTANINRYADMQTTLQRHFRVSGQLTLREGITLRGGGNAGGVEVLAGGTFTMQEGSVIENCQWTMITQGGGVSISGANARFNLEGGTIRNNRAAQGGGIGIPAHTNAIITMSSGLIEGNTADHSGGGVSMNMSASSTFTMTGGTIRNNTAARGGGVFVGSTAIGAFTMTDGSITGNAATGGIEAGNGGGIYTTQADHSPSVSATSFRNLHIGAAAVFADNTARVTSLPPDNANLLTHLRFAQASIHGHIVNNRDINYIGRELPNYQITFHFSADNRGHIGAPITVGVTPNQALSLTALAERGVPVDHIFSTAEVSGLALWGWFREAELTQVRQGRNRPPVGAEGFDLTSVITQGMINTQFTNGNLDLFVVWSLWGDADDDGAVTAADVLLINQWLFDQSLTSPAFGNPINLRAANVTVSGTVTSADATLINQYLFDRTLTTPVFGAVLGARPSMFSTFSNMHRIEPQSQNWFADAMRLLLESEPTISFDEKANRAMAVSTLHHLLGSPDVAFDSIFSDVPSDQWLDLAIAWAYENGFVQRDGEATLLDYLAEFVGYLNS